jgi:hypothetical protein
MSWSSNQSLSLRFCDQKFVYNPLLFQASYMTHPPQPRWPDYPNVRQRVQIVKLLIKQFSPPSCHYLPLRPSLSLERPVLK